MTTPSSKSCSKPLNVLLHALSPYNYKPLLQFPYVLSLLVHLGLVFVAPEVVAVHIHCGRLELEVGEETVVRAWLELLELDKQLSSPLHDLDEASQARLVFSVHLEVLSQQPHPQRQCGH